MTNLKLNNGKLAPKDAEESPYHIQMAMRQWEVLQRKWGGDD